MAVKTLTIDGKHVGAEETETILEAAAEAGVKVPTLCHLDGLRRDVRLLKCHR